MNRTPPKTTLPGLHDPRPRGATPWGIGAETTAFALDEDERELALVGVWLKRIDQDTYEARAVKRLGQKREG